MYAVYNAAWPGHTKIGSTLSLKDRLRAYNTGAPYRDFRIAAAHRFTDRKAAEAKLHAYLAPFRIGTSEWFLIHPLDARNHLISLTKQERYHDPPGAS